MALFRATSAYRIRPSGLFPSGQPHASRRRCFLAVGVSSGYPPPSSPLLFLAQRFEVLPVKPFPKPPQAALNIIFDAHSQDCKASRRAVVHQLKALALVPYCRNVTTRVAPSPIVPKSVDPRLRSFAPPGHPYFNHRVNGDRSRCPPDLFPFEVSTLVVGFPPLTRLRLRPHALSSERTPPLRLKVSIQPELESTQKADSSSMRFYTSYNRFAVLRRAETCSARLPG